MKSTNILHQTLTFLEQLSANNNREWFAEHKNDYTFAHENMIEFADALIVEMNQHDTIETPNGKKAMYRIYSDVRFKKDKSPYNPRFALGLQRATKYLMGGYYMHISPSECMLGCGFFSPNPEDLKRIRQDIDLNYETWYKLLQNKGIKDNFGKFVGERVKTTPKGYAKDHPAIDLLCLKQFIFRHDFSKEEISSPDFVTKVNAIFKSVRPFFDHMSEILTTDANGISIV